MVMVIVLTVKVMALMVMVMVKVMMCLKANADVNCYRIDQMDKSTCAALYSVGTSLCIRLHHLQRNAMVMVMEMEMVMVMAMKPTELQWM